MTYGDDDMNFAGQLTGIEVAGASGPVERLTAEMFAQNLTSGISSADLGSTNDGLPVLAGLDQGVSVI